MRRILLLIFICLNISWIVYADEIIDWTSCKFISYSDTNLTVENLLKIKPIDKQVVFNSDGVLELSTEQGIIYFLLRVDSKQNIIYINTSGLKEIKNSDITNGFRVFQRYLFEVCESDESALKILSDISEINLEVSSFVLPIMFDATRESMFKGYSNVVLVSERTIRIHQILGIISLLIIVLNIIRGRRMMSVITKSWFTFYGCFLVFNLVMFLLKINF